MMTSGVMVNLELARVRDEIIKMPREYFFWVDRGGGSSSGAKKDEKSSR